MFNDDWDELDEFPLESDDFANFDDPEDSCGDEDCASCYPR